jgi:uncharacterized protein YcnI
VVVKPSQAGVASFVTFTVSVPNEKDVATTEVRLLIPDGLAYVTPTVKPGWKITVEKDKGGAVTVISWVGSLPPGFRDDFTFSAQVPAQPGELAWKAYQTYKGNVVVAWDLDPKDPAAHDHEALQKTGKGPYSVTKVVDDLSSSEPMMMKGAPADAAPPTAPPSDPTATWALVVAIVALVVAVGNLFLRPKKK